MQNNHYDNLYITLVLLKSEPWRRETARMGVQWRVRARKESHHKKNLNLIIILILTVMKLIAKNVMKLT